MTIPNRATYRKIPAQTLLILLLFLSITGNPPAAKAESGWQLPQLMAALAHNPVYHLRFVEQKFSTLLTTPLESTGTLRYIPPNKLEKQVLKPHPAHYFIDGTKISIQAADGTQRTINLSFHPPLQAFVAALTATLQGDLATLENYYWVDLEGAREQWQLTLTPQEEDIAEWTKAIYIQGKNGQVLAIKTLQTDGDSSLMRLSEILPP